MDDKHGAEDRRRARSKEVGAWVAGAAILSFVAGVLLAPNVIALLPAKSADNRVFELMIYHTLPGKAATLESVFREGSKLQTKHHLDVVGYWVPNEDPAWKDTFVYLIAHPSRKAAEAHWKELHADPALAPYRDAAAAVIAHPNDDYKVDEIYMRPTDYSRMK